MPNGQYLLIIGSESNTDTTNPTSHDHITLTGGTRALVAPTLPAMPLVTFNSVETSGKYRFRPLTNSCYTQVLAARNAGLVPLIADEWMMEEAYWFAEYETTTTGFPGTPTANNDGSFGSSYTATSPSSG